MAKATILCTDLAGLQAQALGLAEAAGLEPELRPLKIRAPWRYLSPSLWPSPLHALAGPALEPPLPDVLLGAGGAGARVVAALRRPGLPTVAIQHPRMALNRFDLVVAARHDGIAGPNVILTRTALHRATPERMTRHAAAFAPLFASIGRPRVAVLLGGSNGRYRFDLPVARHLACQLAAMMAADHVGLIITPSRRTAPEAVEIFREILIPLGAWIWDGGGVNPYFAMLGSADAIIVTEDSVSMVSEAVATSAPVLLARLPGASTRIGAFMAALEAEGRVRNFAGRLELWDTAPMDDTAAAGAELRRRFGI
jgi:mitochondrial fission protein ELM1